MNRIKHTLLLALALLMSVGAWALPSYHIVGSGQGNWMHGIGWVTDAPENEMAYENGIFTITFENVQPGTHEFLFHNGEMLIGKDNNTENPIQFNTPLGVYELGSSYRFELTAAADVTVTYDATNWKCMVTYSVVEQGISQDQALNWLFTMPDHDADMRLVWKAPADLAWNDVPDGGVSGYRGFHNLVTFPTLANPHSLPVRYGVTDTTIASIDNEGNIVFLAAGQTVVYAIHDFDADYDYDSVTYNLTVLAPATFTLASNDINKGSIKIEGKKTLLSDVLVNGATLEVLLYPGDNNEMLLGGNFTYNDGTFTLNNIISTGFDNQFANATVEGTTITFNAGFFNVNYNHTTTFNTTNDTYETTGNAYHGSLSSVKVNGVEILNQLNTGATYDLPDGVTAGTAENTYLVLPGTEVSVIATAVDGAHVSAWSPINKAVTNLLSDTATFTVGETMTLTATFAQNPLLTLEANNSEWGTVTLDGVTPGVTTYNITISENPYPDVTYTNVSFPFHTKVFIHAGLEYVDAVGQDPLSVYKAGDSDTAIIIIDEAYDGSRTIQYSCGPDGGAKAIFCDAVEGLPIMPEGVTYNGYDTYLVLPGTEVKVIATPDSAHYFVNWTDSAAVNSNIGDTNTLTMGTAPATLTANFAAKPTLTLTQTEGGTLEAIVPQGGAIENVTADMVSTGWQGNTETLVTLADLQDWGFMAVDEAAAAAWTGAPASGYAYLFFGFTSEGKVKLLEFYDGINYGPTVAFYNRGYIYNKRDIIYFTTGTGTSNVVRTADTNTYIIDYGTDVTVQATPAKHYHLVQWSNNVTPGADSTAALNMTEDQTVSATFEKNAPELAWLYRGAEMPAQGVTAYHGFETDTIMLISSTANDEFYMARRQDGAEIHFGSTDTSVVSFADATNPQSITINGAGTTTIYMVHDGSLMAYDSVAFNVTLLAPDTLVLDTTGFGTIAVDGVGSAESGSNGISLMAKTTYYDETLQTDVTVWVPVLTDITLPYSTTLRQLCDTAIKAYPDDVDLGVGYSFAMFGDMISIKNELSSVNPNATVGDMIGNYLTPLNDVNITITDTGVVGFVGDFYNHNNEVAINNGNVGPFRVTAPAATNDSIRAIVSTAGRVYYAVVPGASATITATAGERYHLASWSNGVEVNDILNASQTITIASDSTIVANFEHNPILTLATEGLGTVAIENLGPKTYLGLTVGDIIRVGDKVEIPSTSNSVRFNNAENVFYGHTYELIRANITFDENAEEVVVNPAEDGAYYVFFDEMESRYVLYDYDHFYSEFDHRMPVTEMSDGFIVASYDGYLGGYDKYTLTVHEGNGTPAPAANNNIVADSNNTYSVVPGTQVVVKATPDKYNHLTSWSNNYIVNETLTDTFVVNHSLTLTASFEKNDPELAWTYRGAEMPAQGVTAYHGFETDTIMLISSTANEEFYMARRQDGAEIHFGSTDTSVASFADATNPLSITINGAGTTTIYMVHNGSLMAYDSAYFTVNLLAPDTLTLVHNDGGEMTVEMGASNGGLLTTLYANGSALGTTTTNDTVSLAIEGRVMYNASKGWLAEYGAGNEGSITVTAENGFSIDSCVYYFSSGNRSYTISQSPFAVYPACPSSSIAVYDHPGAGSMDYDIGHEGVVRIEVYGHAAADSIRAISENAYAAVPGAIATVKATPDSVHYIVNFDNDAAINSNIAATKSYTVNGNTTSNVTFTAKPILTLNQTEGGELEVVMPEGGVAATHITSDQIPTWQGSYDPVMEADLQPFGFVPVDSATARTWTGAPAVGDAYLIYDFTGEYYKAHLFRDGQLADWANDYFYKGNFYQFANLAYFTTGADMGTGNITAAAEANKYYVDYGTDVTVQATPDKHYHLAAWSRNVTPGADSTAALTMTENQTVSATFEKNAPELAWRYRRDTMPAEGVTAYLGFTTDTIMLIGTTANEEFRMAYAEEDADLHFGSTNTNVVSFADANDPMSITINGVGTTTIYMVHNGSLMAYDSVTFPVTILQPATLTIAANGNGTLVVDTVSDSIITTATEGRYHVVHGANINLTSTPADKHYMQTWNDVDTAINSNVVVNRNITVTSDTIITATFAHKPIITLASSDTAWGSVKVQLTNYEQLPEGVVVMEGFENRYIIDYGLRVTLVATATEMHHVSHWVDQNVDSLFAAIYREYFVTDPVDLYPATSRLSFIVTVDTTAKAIFGVNCFDVDASVAPHSFSGTAEITYIDVVDSTLSTGANAVVHAVAKGSTTATITATPATGYHFVGWKDNMNEEPEADTLITENPVSVNVMTNYTAVFDTNVYDITVNIDSIEGSVEGPATVKHFLRGTYTATATPCYHFVNWTNEAGDTISTNPTLTIAAISDSAVTANFELNIYTGDTTAVECDQFVWHGITYTATPEEEPTFVYKNHNNCDSTVTLHLTINYHHDTTIYRQASGGFTFLDNYYTENTTDTLTIETVLHCDSNITLVLAVLPHTTPLPVIYNLMDVALTIDHFEGDTGHIDYIFYRWYKDGAIVSEGIDMDSYSEEGTILNGCYHLEISTDEDHQYWATSNEICVGTTGIDDVEAITLTVAPNPVMHGNKANITVNGAANLQGATATVFDAQGRKVLEFGVQNSTFEIQTSTLPSGIYTVRIVLSDGRMATRKLVVR